MREYDLSTVINLPDEEDVEVTVDFTVDSWGSPGSAPTLTYPGDPPEPPEFTITKVTRDDTGAEVKLEDESILYDAIFDRISELDNEPEIFLDY